MTPHHSPLTKRILQIIAISVLVVIIAMVISFFTDKNTYGQWKVHKKSIDTSIAWIPFTWTKDTLGGKFYDKTAMFIPARINDIPYTFQFQFDLGSNVTVLNGNTLEALRKAHPELSRKIRSLKSPLQFWNKKISYKDLTIQMGDYQFKTGNGYIWKNLGSMVENFTSNQVKIGSIGIDIFKDKVLIIDYPGQRFCITNTVPKPYKISLVKIEINTNGSILLPMQYKRKDYKVLFDNGSSMFQLLTTKKRIVNFTQVPDADTIPISSWGIIHNLAGKFLTEPVVIAGKQFNQVKIYVDARKGIDKTYNDGGYDFMTGNAFFWNDIIIIDFKNKKFGVVKGEWSIVNSE